MAKESFYEVLSRAQDEARDVQPKYIDFLRESLHKTGHLDIVTPIPKSKADGIVPAYYIVDGVANKFFIIIECKFEQSLENDVFRAGVILQTICYLKQFKLNGDVIPRIALIGNKKQCFALPVSCLQPYIDKDIVKLSDASNAYSNNPGIVKEIVKDENITKHCHLYDITKDFSMDTVAKEILELAKGNPIKLEIEENSISKVFDYFTMHILKEREVGYKGEKVALPPRIQKDLFMMMLLNPDDCYLHPNKKDTALFGIGNQRLVNSSAYIAFKNMYQFKYSLEEKRRFTEICDRLIEDAERRNKGDFYTPTVWVDEAHKLMEQELGEDWRDNYIVWDCCCGTKNLTRDYKFRQLYSSTIEQGDIEIGKRYNLNIDEYNSVAFQYDFLNDDVDLFEKLLEKKNSGVELTELDFLESSLYLKAPGLIRGLLKGRPLAFLINPPYSTTANMKNVNNNTGSKEKGLGDTGINKLMEKDNVGASRQQLYAQFIYRTLIFRSLFGVNVVMGIFCPTLLFTGEHFEWFRSIGLKNSYKSGFCFEGCEFADVTPGWGISFSIWDYDGSGNDTYELAVLKNNMGVPNFLGNKCFYSVKKQDKVLSYIKSKIKDTEIEVETMSTGINFTGKMYKHKKNCMGYLFMDTPRVEYNNQYVTLMPHKMKGNKIANALYPDNFENSLSLFAARRLITGEYANWVNWQDEYMIPNMEHEKYEEWVNDSIIYSLFNGKSNQSSLRVFSHNIRNEFFFMSEQEMKDLANGKFNRDDINDEIALDIENYGGDRFVYKKLQEITLSVEAQAVLDKARELVKLSFNNRDLFNQMHPEYQINCWDAGWYQIKGLLKEFHKEELESFNKLYKALEDKMRPMVYELGFLKK